MDHLPRLSETVYVGLCRNVGSRTEVRIRREVMDTMESATQPVNIMRGSARMCSGSRSEGFRLRTSDFDYMQWPPDHKVICDLSQINLYRIPKHTVILMECDNLPPGFTIMKLMSQSDNKLTIPSCVVMNNNMYISSTLFREKYLQFFNSCNVPTAVPHGPCSKFAISTGREADNVFCFQSHHWPMSALPWIQRCRVWGWPKQNVLSDILSGGFHVVPIGSTPENKLEWRISFSRAEKKIVHSMNHCQFLCYGLFKFFLKDVINWNPNTSTLCSYFIKTVVFWVIQKNTSLSWTPDNLLFCFWESFKLLIYMVHTGECPNFFIPQNNMFRVKVTGSVQTSLFSQLYDLYSKGVSCLLLSSTIRHYLRIAILQTTLRLCTVESSIISATKLDIVLFAEISSCSYSIFSIKDFGIYMKQIHNMIERRPTSYEAVYLQCLTSNVLRNTAMFLLSRSYQKNPRNKVFYKVNKGYKLLKQSCRFGFLSDILYLAMYFYRTRRYQDSLSYLHKAHENMSLPYVMYWNSSNVDMYKHSMERKSLGTKMRRAVVRDINLQSVYTYIDELVLEQQVVSINSLKIPPLVMLHMLFILNHLKLGDTVRSQQSLHDLQTLLRNNDMVHVFPYLRDISWQILGICQQICGDYSGSLQSYRYSLKQLQLHRIQKATFRRIDDLRNVAI